MNVLGKKTKSCSTKGINANYLENTILDLVLDIINSSNLYKELDSALRERIKFLNGINGKNQERVHVIPLNAPLICCAAYAGSLSSSSVNTASTPEYGKISSSSWPMYGAATTLP